MIKRIFNRVNDRLVEMNPKKFWAGFISILFTLFLIQTVLVANLVESIYLQEVYDKMYVYSYFEYDLEENTTYIVLMTIQDGYFVKRDLNVIRQVYLVDIDKDLTIFIVNISMNIAITEGSIVLKNFTLVHQKSLTNSIYIDHTISEINTTIDKWDVQTTTLFLVSFKTSDIAKSLGIPIPFWFS